MERRIFISCVIVAFISNLITCEINDALYPDYKNIWNKNAREPNCPSDIKCDPNVACSAQGVEQGLKVPDPEDCAKFYYCYRSEGDMIPTYTSYSCPSGQKFNKSSCDCAPDDASIKCCSSSGGGGGSSGIECKNDCDCNSEEVCYEGISTNCSQFNYYSQPAASCPTLHSCPNSRPYFDQNTNNCSTDNSKCCYSCTPYCEKKYTAIADPCDCYKFYICMDVGEPPENNYHVACEDGNCFDSETGECGECENINNVCHKCNGTDTCPTTSTAATTTAATTTAANTTAEGDPIFLKL